MCKYIHVCYTASEYYSVSLHLSVWQNCFCLRSRRAMKAGSSNTLGKRSQESVQRTVNEASALNWAWWWTPAVPVRGRAGVSLEPRSSRLAWATATLSPGKEEAETWDSKGESSEWERGSGLFLWEFKRESSDRKAVSLKGSRQCVVSQSPARNEQAT